jgi:hypothetical protein
VVVAAANYFFLLFFLFGRPFLGVLAKSASCLALIPVLVR